MLLLVTILLVVVGTISLVIGFVQSSLLPIYISIACSVLAAVVLLIFSRMTAKSQQVVTAADGPTPLDPGKDRAGSDQDEPEPAFAGTGLLAGSSSSADTFAPENRYGSGSRLNEDADGDDDLVAADAPAAELDDDFPIERYDSRRVGEILPLLAELDLDELDIVREHEEQGKSRATVLARIDQLIDRLEAEDRHEAAHRLDTGPAVAAGIGVDHDELAGDRDGHDDVSAPFSGPGTLPPPPPTQPVTVAALPDDDGYFPIEDYDDLRASEILPLLPELDDDELAMVEERERSGAARSSVLSRIESLLPESADTAPAPLVEPEPIPMEMEPLPAMAAVVSPAKRAGAKRAPAVKKSVPNVVPAKKAAPAKRTATVAPPLPVKKAPPVRKAAPVKAAKKAVPAPVEPPAKAAAKKVPGKVAAARAAAASKGGGTASAAAAAKATKATKATRKTTKG